MDVGTRRMDDKMFVYVEKFDHFIRVLSKDDLIAILQRNIKGKYDYKRILSGGLAAQNQFVAHLKSRWNPLEPEKPGKDMSPYHPVKKRVQGTE